MDLVPNVTGVDVVALQSYIMEQIVDGALTLSQSPKKQLEYEIVQDS